MHRQDMPTKSQCVCFQTPGMHGSVFCVLGMHPVLLVKQNLGTVPPHQSEALPSSSIGGGLGRTEKAGSSCFECMSKTAKQSETETVVTYCTQTVT